MSGLKRADMDPPRARCHKRVHNIYTSLTHTLVRTSPVKGSASFALTHCNQLPEWDGTVELGSTVLSALLGIADRLPTLVAATQRAKAAAVVDPVLCDAFPDLPSKVLAQTLQDAEAQLANLRSIMYALPQAAGLPCAGSLSVNRAASGWMCRS